MLAEAPIANNPPVYTADSSDFETIDDLEVVAVEVPTSRTSRTRASIEAGYVTNGTGAR